MRLWKQTKKLIVFTRIIVNYEFQFLLKNVAPYNTVMRVISCLESSTMTKNKLPIRCRQALSTSENGGNNCLETNNSSLHKYQIDTNKITVAQCVFIEWKAVLVAHFLDLTRNVLHSSEGVGKQMSRTIEILEYKLV